MILTLSVQYFLVMQQETKRISSLVKLPNGSDYQRDQRKYCTTKFFSGPIRKKLNEAFMQLEMGIALYGYC